MAISSVVFVCTHNAGRSQMAAGFLSHLSGGSIAVEFMHLVDPRQRQWIAERMEAPAPPIDRPRLLEQILRAEIFEETIQTRYIGSKRFSIEGVAALIPLLVTAIEECAEDGALQAMIAMSHRGRLNVMTQVIGRTPVEIFAGFEDVDPRSVLGSGDVKYHLGATGTLTTPTGKRVRLHLNSNPSHLEVVSSVAMGRMRAKLTRERDVTGRTIVPLLLHGDSAFAGQGIAAETLNPAGNGPSVTGLPDVGSMTVYSMSQLPDKTSLAC